MSFSFIDQNEICQMMILILLSHNLYDDPVTFSWVSFLTEFGCNFYQLQDWIFLSTAVTDDEILLVQKASYCCIEVSGWTYWIGMYMEYYLSQKIITSCF